MKKLTLVTGGTGFIGSHLVEALVDRGERLRCLVRKTSNIAHLKKLGVELVCGDLLDKESLKSAVKNVSVIYHLAAQVRPHKIISRLRELSNTYQEVNVGGTKNLVEASSAEDISKFIYFSSIAAVGTGVNLTEASPCQPITDYGKSKFESEKYILSLVRTKNFPALIIRPGQVYGPRCLAMYTFFKLIKYGIFLTIGNGANWIPVCYVNDLINGTLLAEKRGKIGDIYFIFEKVYMFREYVQTIAQAVGGRLSRLYFPKSIAYLSALFKEACESIFRFKIYPFHMDLSKGGVLSISTSWLGSIEKARIELGYNPIVDLGKGIELTVKWYRNVGLL